MRRPSTWAAQWRSSANIVAFALALGSVGMILAAAPSARAQNPVSIYVTVEQGDKLILGLKHQNFRLFEDGKPVEFKLEEPEKPVTVALLVEYSRSSALYFNDIQAAVAGFLKSAPEGNWYGVATFAKDLEIRADFTREKGEVEDAFASLGEPTWSDIDTYDAVYQMLDRMGELKGRRVLILIGSGLNTFSKHTLDDVRKAVHSNNVTVYGIGAGSLLRGKYESRLSTSGRTNLLHSENFMRTLANESGGEAWFPKFESAIPSVMKGVMQSIESQYRLVYAPVPSGSGKLQKIKVEAFQVVNDKRQNYKVRFRAGWRY